MESYDGNSYYDDILNSTLKFYLEGDANVMCVGQIHILCFNSEYTFYVSL